MQVTLEKIDLIRSRAHVSYEEAKNALEHCEGNEIEALIYLEKQQKTSATEAKQTTQKGHTGPSLWDEIKAFIMKVHAIRFVVEKNDLTVVNIPLTLLLISLAILFPFVVMLLILAILFGYKLTFVKSKTESYEVNAILDATFGADRTANTVKPEATEPVVDETMSKHEA